MRACVRACVRVCVAVWLCVCDMCICTCTCMYSNSPLSLQISNIINRHAVSLQKRSEHDQFFMNTNPVMQLVQQ